MLLHKENTGDNNVTNTEYIQLAVRTESDLHPLRSTVKSRLLHGGIGISTEAGELLDNIKKHLFYKRPLDLVNMKEEAGDIFWYMAIVCDTCGWSFDEIMERNIEKLKVRYPDKFSVEKAIERNVELELEKIKEGTTP